MKKLIAYQRKDYDILLEWEEDNGDCYCINYNTKQDYFKDLSIARNGEKTYKKYKIHDLELADSQIIDRMLVRYID